MKIYNEPFPIINEKISAVALGTFDGVHSGHKAVINEAVHRAHADGGLSAVWCFSSPPKAFFSNDKASAITSADEKADRIKALGVDILIMATPDAAIFSMSKESFADAVCTSLHPSHVVVGFNYRFGANAEGTPLSLAEYLMPRGIGVTVIPAVLTADGVPVSSTLIRQYIERGEDVSRFFKD